MKRRTLILFVLFAVCAAHPAGADDRVAKLEARIAKLERRVAKLEALLRQAAKVSPRKADNVRAPQIRPGDYKNKANWRRLKRGMTQAQVTEILGDPPKLSAYETGDHWYYPDILSGKVEFDKSGRVKSWSEP